MEDIRFRIEMYDCVDLARLAPQYSLRPVASLRPGVYLTLGYYGLSQRLVLAPLQALRLTKAQLELILYVACVPSDGEVLNGPVVQAVREARSWVAHSPVAEYTVS